MTIRCNSFIVLYKGGVRLKDRIKDIRKALNLSQDEFASALGYTRGKITNIESGKVVPAADDPFISLLCRMFNVNRNYLETGEGDMFLPRSRNQIITDFSADLLNEEDESFRRRFVEALAALDVEDWEALEKIANSLQKKD